MTTAPAVADQPAAAPDTVEVWPLRDAFVFTLVFLIALGPLTLILGWVLSLLTPWVRLPAEGEVVLRQTVWGAAFRGGLALSVLPSGFLASEMIGVFYPRPAHRRMAMAAMRHRRGGWGRHIVEVVERSRARRTFEWMGTVFAICLFGLGGLGFWWSANHAFLAADATTIRFCEGLFEPVRERPVTDVAEVWVGRTTGRRAREYMTLRFKNGQRVTDRDAQPTGPDRARFAQFVADRAGVVVRQGQPPRGS